VASDAPGRAEPGARLDSCRVGVATRTGRHGEGEDAGGRYENEDQEHLALVPALALGPLLGPDFAAHTDLALITVLVALLGLAAVLAISRPRRAATV
jgi:hypothetical protein